MRRSFILLIAMGATLLAACSLAGDVTPPPGSRSTISTPPATLPTVAAPVDSGLTYPTFKPSAAEGAAVFAAHCAACHGTSGKSDGELSAQLMAQRSDPLPDFSSSDLARANAPAAWFHVITAGRLDRLMPPWAEKLSEAERWNVTAFLYTLSTPQSQIDSGQAIYAAKCAECHGESGQGDGPKSSGLTLPDFTDQAFMAAVNPIVIFNAVTNGVGEGMPAFHDTLTDAERWAALDYVRTFAYDDAPPGAAPLESAARVTGAVTNGTAGAVVPADLTMTLHGFDNFNAVLTATTTVGVSGAFIFEDVPHVPGRQFILSTEYGGVNYGSEVFTFDDGPAVETTVTLYEPTSDASVLRVESMHVFFDFSAAGTTVGELYLFANDGDRTYAPAGGQTLQFPLPSGASDVAVQGGEEGVDFFHTADGLAVAAPIRPGPNSARILLSFHLPYDRRLDFAQKVLYPVSALNVLLPEGGVQLRGGNLQDRGVQDIQGNSFRTYDASGVAAGEMVSFQLSGRPASAASGPSLLTASDPASFVIGLGALALVLAGAGTWWFRRLRTPEAEPASREDLLQAIADLDDDFEAGDIGEGEYRRERARLKTKLSKLMEE